MIRVSVLGATGKVGAALCKAIATAPGLTLAEAISGSKEAEGVTKLALAELTGTDVLVDFSTPEGNMHLLDRLSGNPMPLVIGTTGFSPAQSARLEAEGTKRPILIGANFTKGFEVFAATARHLAAAFPGAVLTVGEVYNARKKPAPSGTTQRLCRELGGVDGRDIATEIGRVGDTAGINNVVLDYGVATLRLELTVSSRAAYAEGALEAARWLIGRPNGLYHPKDMLKTNRKDLP